MPADQRGSLVRPSRGRGWAYRIYVDGKRTYRGGFETKSAAAAAMQAALLQLDQPVRRDLTVQQLVDEFLEQYDREPGSVATLTANLKHVTAKFGDKRIDRLPVSELKAWPKRLIRRSKTRTGAKIIRSATMSIRAQATTFIVQPIAWVMKGAPNIAANDTKKSKTTYSAITNAPARKTPPPGTKHALPRATPQICR